MKIKILLPLLILLTCAPGFAQLKSIELSLQDKPDFQNNDITDYKSEFYRPVKLNDDRDIHIIRNVNLKRNLLKDIAYSDDRIKTTKKEFNLSATDTLRYHRYYPEYNPKRNMLIPIGEVLFINFGLAAFNNYVGNQPYAKITFKSVQHNLDTGFVWDDDVFVVNQFGHPYHGGLYFSTARTSGYNFWESFPYAFGGSLMWEMFMETDPPQTNDLIQTSIGGAMLGEMTYRLSSLILDESTSGTNRVLREIAATIISPVRGFNRLIHGDMSRRTKRNINDVFPVYNRLNLGYAGINPNEQVKFEKSHLMIEYIFTYGNTFDNGIVNPFDFFRLRLGFDARKGDAPSSWAYAYGLLWGKNLTKREDSRFIIGVFHDYDFFYNQLYKLGSQSVGLGFIYFSPVQSKLRTLVSFHSNFIALSALNSIYRKGEVRDYDYGIGNKTMLEGGLMYGPLSLILEYRFYYTKTVNGFPGHSSFGFFNPKILVDIYKGFGAGLEYIFYHRFGTFEGVADYSKRTSEQRLYLSYFF